MLKQLSYRVFHINELLFSTLYPLRKPIHIKSIDEIPQRIKAYGFDSVLFVTGPHINKMGLTTPLKQALEKEGINYILYDKTSSNPTTANVNEAYELYIRNQCDAIIGFGGGSPIDCAKAVGIRSALPKASLEMLQGAFLIKKKMPPIFAIPTTAGSGSEVSIASVITDEEKKKKYFIADPCLVPRFVYIDPHYTLLQPKLSSMYCAMDALSHAIESDLSLASTRGTRYNSKKAIRLIYGNIDKVYDDSTNYKARRNLSIASYSAGLAFTRAYVGYIHALAHALGGAYNIPHGKAIAVIMPHVLEYYSRYIPRRIKRIAIAANIADKTTPADLACRMLIDSLYDMLDRYEIGRYIEELKVDDIKKLAHNAAQEANPLYPVPVIMDQKQLERILIDVLLFRG
ncbi:MAG TPA: alcohol dehydrogenase [Eubacterium sp.]|nr:alcohol dehydrogenase [Eubacterium sp.]